MLTRFSRLGLGFGSALALVVICMIWPDTQGVVRVLSVLGTLFLIPVPLILGEIVIEIVRSIWQSWIIAAWMHDRVIDLALRKPSRVGLFFRVWHREIFSLYTTTTINERVFPYHPWGVKDRSGEDGFELT